MKIVHLVGHFQENMGYQEHYLAKHQAEMGHEVYLVTSDLLMPTSKLTNIIVAFFKTIFQLKTKLKNVVQKKIDGFTLIRLSAKFNYSDFVLVHGLRDLITRIRPEIIICHEAKGGMTAQVAGYKNELGFKLVYNQHDFFHHIPNHVWWKKILRYADYFYCRKFIVQWALNRADTIISPVDEVKNFLIKKHGITPEKIISIPLGFETDLFHYSVQERTNIRKQYAITPGDIVILFAGRIDRRKLIEKLLEICADFNNEFTIKLLIIGSGEEGYMKELHACSQNYGIKSRVQFVQFVKKSDLYKYFSAADIGLWVANNSITIMEAMATRLPCVFPKLQLSYLANQNAGFIFEPGDWVACKRFLRHLLADGKSRQQLGQYAEQQMHALYSEYSRSKRITDLCASLMQ